MWVFFSILGSLRACAGGRTRAGGKGRKLVLPLVWQELVERWPHTYGLQREATSLTCLLWAALKLELRADRPEPCLVLSFLLYATMPPWCTLGKNKEPQLGSDIRVHPPWKHSQTQYFVVTYKIQSAPGEGLQAVEVRNPLPILSVRWSTVEKAREGTSTGETRLKLDKSKMYFKGFTVPDRNSTVQMYLTPR